MPNDKKLPMQGMVPSALASVLLIAGIFIPVRASAVSDRLDSEVKLRPALAIPGAGISSPAPPHSAPAGREIAIQEPAHCQASAPLKAGTAGFRWESALKQSGFFLGIQHGFRMFEIETRRELDGPFFKDYADALRGLKGWGDGDSWTTNYLAHPLMGSAAGYIQVHNDPGGSGLEFGNNPAYWRSRLKAMGWAAAYSLQFELGPAGEAAIGNVGLRPGTMGYVDLVITPLGGFGIMVLEDLIDRHWIRKLEARTSSRNLRGFYRIAMNPTRSLANFLRFRHLYHRDTR